MDANQIQLKIGNFEKFLLCFFQKKIASFSQENPQFTSDFSANHDLGKTILDSKF